MLLSLLFAASGCARQPIQEGSGPEANEGLRYVGGETDTLSGTVTYRERMALPPGAVVHVRLEDVTHADAPATLLAQQTISTGGRQVPLPFNLAYDPAALEPDRRYAIRAEIRDEAGALLFTTPTPSVVTGEAPAGGLTLMLQRASNAAGDSVASPTSGPWAEARRRGVDFRAVGNEPGWSLDIVEGDSLVVVTNYGADRAVTPFPEPAGDGARTTYHAVTEAHEVEVVIEQTPCTDTMSGERFEATVTVTLDGQTYRGCGRAL